MPATREIRIEWSVMLIDPVLIPAGSVALPDFHERVWRRPSILIDNPAGNNNPLPQRFARMLLRQIKRLHIDIFAAKQRPGHFR
jgi:hypothetical protein